MKKLLSSVVALGMVALPGLFGASANTLATDRQAGRILDQAAWGPTPSDIAQVQSMGLAGWIAAQMNLNTSDLPDQTLVDLLGNTNNNLNPVRSAFFLNTVTGQDQLRQRVAFALSEIFVVSQAAGVTNAYAYPPYWRILRDNAFGNYAEIIKAITLNPAMGRYLNMANNNKATGTASANENYGRELMQLFTLGLTKLNMDGSVVFDQTTHAPVPTYTEQDVRAVAKALTGWTYPTAPNMVAKGNNPAYYLGQMLAVTPTLHDTSADTIFGNFTIPPGTAEQDLDALIRILMQQPTMAPFVSRQLIEHLVTSNPSPGYISRVSSIFENNGNGVTGDMKAVITAILMDSEARMGDDPSAAPIATAGHLREPVLLISNLLRGLNAAITAANTVYNSANTLGQNLFVEPSVFSYFSPASRTEKGLYGPEFQIYTTQTSTDRANTIYNALYGALDGSTKINLAPFVATVQTKNFTPLVNYISYVFFHNSASPALMTQAAAAAAAAPTPTRAVQSALFVALTSAEYQVIH